MRTDRAGPIKVRVRSDVVRFELQANLCTKLVGEGATFHADGSGYMQDGCGVFDNRNPYGNVRPFVIEPVDALVHVETGTAENGTFCQLTCAR